VLEWKRKSEDCEQCKNLSNEKLHADARLCEIASDYWPENGVRTRRLNNHTAAVELATVVIGGVLSSTFLTLVLLRVTSGCVDFLRLFPGSLVFYYGTPGEPFGL
jgi:hypothetical protein